MVGVEKGTLIMYDQQTKSRWSQLFGEAVSGEMQGKALQKVASTMTTWGLWRAMHPDTTVYVKPETPYRSRFTADTFAEAARAKKGPVAANDIVIGVEGHVVAHAYLLRGLAEKRVLNDVLENAPIVVYLASDMATFRIFDRSANGQTLTMEIAPGDKLRDQETGTIWDPMSGEAIEGQLKGLLLKPHTATYSLWFAWKKYRPETVLVER